MFCFCISEKVYGNDNTKKVSYCVLCVFNDVVLLALFYTMVIVLFESVSNLNIDSLSN